MVQTKMEQSVELSESTESNVLKVYHKVWDAAQIFEMDFNKESTESDMFKL